MKDPEASPWRASSLGAFLSRNSVAAASGLPLVHTTRSYNFRAILADEKIEPQECDVFTGEKLTYFFVGRPAYKYDATGSDAEVWELPCCFIFGADLVSNPRRVFPFDSGAFSKRLYPSYINKMPLDEFIVGDLQGCEKLIGTFFGSADRYFKMKPRPREDVEQQYSLTPLDAEILAISRLASEGSATRFDDRRFAIEVQSSECTNLIDAGLLAVVLPEPYLALPEIRDRIQIQWRAEAIGYPMYSLSVEMYYSTIYHAVHRFYERRGFI